MAGRQKTMAIDWSKSCSEQMYIFFSQEDGQTLDEVKPWRCWRHNWTKTLSICVWPYDPALRRSLDWRPPVVPSNLTYPVIIKSQRKEDNKKGKEKWSKTWFYFVINVESTTLPPIIKAQVVVLTIPRPVGVSDIIHSNFFAKWHAAWNI